VKSWPKSFDVNLDYRVFQWPPVHVVNVASDLLGVCNVLDALKAGIETGFWG
jgi:hypothetical protein